MLRNQSGYFIKKKITSIGEINKKEEKCIARSHLINAAGEPCYFKFTTPSCLHFKMLLDEYDPPSGIYKPID